MVVRIANQCCHVRFSTGTKTNELVDLHHKIDPSNPEFIRLNLIFYYALYEIGSNAGLGYFCSLLLKSCGDRILIPDGVSAACAFYYLILILYVGSSQFPHNTVYVDFKVLTLTDVICYFIYA